MKTPVICFGQQPCGIFPKRFLVSKIWTAKSLQRRIGGEIVFFLHDSDHDPRETATALRHLKTGAMATINFDFANKLQKKYTPLYAKRVSREWQSNLARQLPNYVRRELVELFASVEADNVADFCLEMYRGMGLLEGVRVERSSDPELRRRALAIDDYFVDTPYEGELVRARRRPDGRFALHQGGDSYLEIAVERVDKSAISPCRDTRLRWMQSALPCSYYIAGASETQYLDTSETPEISFMERDPIDRSSEAYVGD